MKLGILCGGRSGEHEVSLQSAQGIFAATERPRFDPILVAIDKQGNWRAGTPETLLLHRDDPSKITINPEVQVVTPTGGHGNVHE